MKIAVIILLVLSVFETIAVDADFSGETRFRLTTDVEDITVDGVIDELTNNLNPEIRNKISGSFRPSESFEANTMLYLNQSGLSNDVRAQFVSYGDWMISDEFMIRIGQTEYELGKGLVIGSNDFEELPTLLSGAILTYSSENIGIDLGIVKKVAIKKNSEESEDFGNLFIVSLDFRSLSDAFKEANVHAVVAGIKSYIGEEEQPKNAPIEEQPKNAPIYVGASLGGDILTDLSYSATASGNTRSLSLKNIKNNYLLNVGLKYKMDDLKLYAGAHISGSSYTPLYYDVHRNAGKLDIARLGDGLAYGKLGAFYMLNADSALGLSGYYFFKGNDSVLPGSIEVDLAYKNNFNSSVSGKLVAGVLKQSTSYKAKAYMNLSMKF